MKVFLFLNGNSPNPEVVRRSINKKSFLIAADGASNYLKRLNILPDVIIGDLDSIRKTTFEHYKAKKVQIIKITEQETTDFEKCLKYCIKKNLKDITVFGAVSERPDHTLNNFSVLKKFHSKCSIRIISGEYEVLFIKKKISFGYKMNETISLLALPVAEGISTTGLQYPLLNESLGFGIREGTLNKSISEKITISFKSGSLLLFKKHFIL
ncbi:MAG: thiamine diphosphokinase [Ignavibacteria bacterium]